MGGNSVPHTHFSSMESLGHDTLSINGTEVLFIRQTLRWSDLNVNMPQFRITRGETHNWGILLVSLSVGDCLDWDRKSYPGSWVASHSGLSRSREPTGSIAVCLRLWVEPAELSLCLDVLQVTGQNLELEAGWTSLLQSRIWPGSFIPATKAKVAQAQKS